MMKNKNLKSVLITGGAARLGRHLALTLADMGWMVHLHYHTKVADAEDVKHLIHQSGGSCTLHQADLADAAAAETLMRDISYHDGQMALINNASLFELDTAQDVSAEMMARHMAVNAIAPAVMIKAFADKVKPLFPATRGAVINITDAKLSGLNPDYYSYTVSKMALDGLTTIAAQAYAPYLRVNGVAPGIMLRSGDQTQAEYEIAHRRNPLGQGAQLEDISRSVIMILDTMAMTGHTVTIDGGLHLRPPNRDVAFLDE